MEMCGTPEQKLTAREGTRDFDEWEKLGAELPEIYSQPPHGLHPPNSPSSPCQNQVNLFLFSFAYINQITKVIL